MTDSIQKLNIEATLKEIAKFQFVLAEGRKGYHLLFDPETIRRTFLRSPQDLLKLFQSRLDEINTALNQTFVYPSFEEKRDYIRSLPAEIQEAMIYGYFQLMDGDKRQTIH